MRQLTLHNEDSPRLWLGQYTLRRPTAAAYETSGERPLLDRNVTRTQQLKFKISKQELCLESLRMLISQQQNIIKRCKVNTLIIEKLPTFKTVLILLSTFFLVEEETQRSNYGSPWSHRGVTTRHVASDVWSRARDASSRPQVKYRHSHIHLYYASMLPATSERGSPSDTTETSIKNLLKLNIKCN